MSLFLKYYPYIASIYFSYIACEHVCVRLFVFVYGISFGNQTAIPRVSFVFFFFLNVFDVRVSTR